MLDSLFEIFAVVVGFCVGSFANVVICRLPRGESVVSPSSFCPDCRARLKWRDMIPVISWIFLKGRCRYCKAAISGRYPIIETACAALFVLTTRFLEADIVILPLWCLVFVLLCVAVVDWDAMEIPDGLLVVGAMAGLIWIWLVPNSPGWLDVLLGVAAGALPLLILDRLVWIIAKKPGFGLGDTKLMAMAGLFLGWQGMPAAYFIAFVSGGLYGIALLITKKAERGDYIAFGPFLCLGILSAIFIISIQ